MDFYFYFHKKPTRDASTEITVEASEIEQMNHPPTTKSNDYSL